MKKLYISSVPCSICQRLLIYGFFSVISHVALSTCYILFLHSAADMHLILHEIIPYAEMWGASVTLLIGGALLIDRLNIELEN